MSTETEEIEPFTTHRLRFLQTPSEKIYRTCAELPYNVIVAPVLANGRIELLNYLREVSISADYHRYGNLGTREGEGRGKCVGETAQKCCNKTSCCM
jgi:RHH-type proline utilization regulon transcriptional repressor/proline dehydrogenase/delta 1-pyrroline-5-carboxylate dehydrogenase